MPQKMCRRERHDKSVFYVNWHSYQYDFKRHKYLCIHCGYDVFTTAQPKAPFGKRMAIQYNKRVGR
jgi:hypothetical protein